MEKLTFKVLTVLLLALLTSSCMTMGLGHLNTNQQQNHHVSSGVRYTDPVCGNSIEQVSEDLSYEYNDSVYYFHTSNCLNEFKQAPERYINNSDTDYHQNNLGMMWWGLGAATMVGMMMLMIL